MKKLLTSILIIVLPTAIFAIAGAGLQVTPGMGTIGATTDTKSLATMTTTEFSIPFSIGGYLYIDAIPFVDLEVDLMAMGNKYEFGFVNNLGTIGPYDFGWASLSTYFTLRKKLLGVGIPLLAKAKLFYGGGFNMHAVTPLMTVDLMESTWLSSLGSDQSYTYTSLSFEKYCLKKSLGSDQSFETYVKNQWIPGRFHSNNDHHFY